MQDSSRMDMLEKLLLRLVPEEDEGNNRITGDIEDDRSFQQLYKRHLKDLHISTRSRPSAFRYSHVLGGYSFDGSSSSNIPLHIAGSKRNFDRNGWGGGYGRK